MPDGDSFLPRIQSVFYAVFDVRQGPKIVYQVPEGLIAVPPPNVLTSNLPSTSSPVTPLTEQFAPVPFPGVTSRNSSTSLVSPNEPRPASRSVFSPRKRSGSASRILFNFDDISKYVIPQSQLCGRLVTCSTKRHRIIGFPVELKGPKYQRNYLRYNLCFVFERGADLSCYEPIVRKVSRVLTACEEESGFLSSPKSLSSLHAILEQLYEDLNSYSETSIPIDRFNSIELKIFPFYPNPPPVKDWMVPLALINLTKRIEDNWDLTMVKVCRYIDGVNHVSRIAHLADCDLSLTRLAISHLLYYQVIMTIDIFQYSNMYTLRKCIQNLAVEADVKEECGPYVTKPGCQIPDWPKLLHLYSRLKPGKTVLDWMETYEIHELGIDVRRFVSFGVIKGFLRRVHRWPVLLPIESDSPPSDPDPTSVSHRKRMNSLSGSVPFGGYSSSPTAAPIDLSPSQNFLRGRTPQTTPVVPSLSPDSVASPVLTSPRPAAAAFPSIPGRARRASAAEKVLEQLRNREVQKTGGSPRTSWIHYTNESEPGIGITATTTAPQDSPARTGGSESRRQSLSLFPVNPPPSPVLAKATVTATLTPSRPRISRSPSAPVPQTRNGVDSWGSPPYPKDLLPLLDGEHHTDELAVRFEAGWPLMEQWLLAIGGGDGPGDFGRVAIIHR
ncbi:nitrogen permease regulator 2-domain-containing protein [Mycena albidolilacea]|uniref:Nitrogen permease regulator 2-domain-containing protein n=1 Tax=Mycena albidolilacea TaxID=1033008 RepID=A0AAD6ZX42_9AGAR|nr:nitrogen permease regulator 2-domain-containing protein [Mycena albidolilacea]